VYLFFTLSGFLIIRLIYHEKSKHKFSIKKFYIRRALRILPLYYTIVIFGFLFYNILLPFLEIPFDINYNFTEGFLMIVFFLPNIFSVLYEPGGILDILWSIGIEEQFYLIIAPLMLFMKKPYILKVLIGLLIIYFIIFHLPSFEMLKQYNFVFFFILSGGIIAILEEKDKLEFLKISIIFPIVIITTVVLFFTTYSIEFESLWMNNLMISLLFSLTIHVLSCNHQNIIIKNKILNYFGSISYGIYMYHVIALNAIVFIFFKLDFNFFNDFMTTTLINIMTFVFSILMAHLSFKYFETFFLKLKDKFRI